MVKNQNGYELSTVPNLDFGADIDGLVEIGSAGCPLKRTRITLRNWKVEVVEVVEIT